MYSELYIGMPASSTKTTSPVCSAVEIGIAYSIETIINSDEMPDIKIMRRCFEVEPADVDSSGGFCR